MIGKGGATIRQLTEETGAVIDIDDNGTIRIFGAKTKIEARPKPRLLKSRRLQISDEGRSRRLIQVKWLVLLSLVRLSMYYLTLTVEHKRCISHKSLMRVSRM